MHPHDDGLVKFEACDEKFERTTKKKRTRRQRKRLVILLYIRTIFRVGFRERRL